MSVKNLAALTVLWLSSPAQALICDADGDGDVDRQDINQIFAARNQPASGAGDPRDTDGDGVITVNDGRACFYRCTLPGCVSPPPTPVNVTPVVTALLAPGLEGYVEGDTVQLAPAVFEDADSGDTHTATIDWGDGAAPEAGQATSSSGGGTVDGNRTYADEQVTQVEVCVTDQEGATGCDAAPLEVINAPPIVNAGPNVVTSVGDTVALTSTAFTDRGRFDTHTATIDWGDGASGAGLINQGEGDGTVDGAHAFDAGGVYTVEVCVNDDDGGSGCDSLIVDVAAFNAPPAFTSAPVTTAVVDYPYSYDAHAVDPDPLDVLRFSLLTGPAGAILDPESGELLWRPSTEQVGSHEVSIQVTDLRGAADTQSYPVTVAEPAEEVTTTTPGFVATTFANGDLLRQPTDLEFNNAGDLLVVNSTSYIGSEGIYLGNVLAIGPNGEQRVFGDGPLAGPRGLALTTAGPFGEAEQMLVGLEDLDEADGRAGPTGRNDAIVKFPPTGGDSTIFTLTLEAQTIAFSPTGAFDGDLLVAQQIARRTPYRIFRVNAAGQVSDFPVQLASGEEVTGAFTLGFGHGGSFGNDLYLGTFDDADNRDPDSREALFRVAADGTATELLSGTTNGSITGNPAPDGPFGDYLYVVDRFAGTVHRVTADGTPTLFATGFESPRDMTFGPNGDLFVADTAGGDIVRIFPSLDTDFNFPPAIVTEPAREPFRPLSRQQIRRAIGDVGVEFRYDVDALDVEGDALTYALIEAPATMQIEPLSGLVTFTPSAEGIYRVTVGVTDAVGGSDTQSFELDIGGVAPALNNAPAITTTPEVSTLASVTYRYDVNASDPDFPDEIIAFRLDSAPAGMEIDAVTGLVTWEPGFTDAGDHEIAVRVQDLNGGIDVQRFVLTVLPDTEAPDLSVVINPTIANPGESITIQIKAFDNSNEASLAVLLDGQPLTLGQFGRATFSSNEPGAFSLVATATDPAGNAVTQERFVRVRDPSDSIPPVAIIESPEDLTEVTYLHDLVGTASDDNLLRYQVGLARGSNGAFSIIAEGTSSIVDDVLMVIDPTLMENGLYRVRLVVEDLNGLVAVDEKAYRVNGLAKVGIHRIGFLDLAVPVAGIPIGIERIYDSRIKAKEDFGIGWTLDVRRGTFEHNRKPGRGWEILASGGLVPLPCQTVNETLSHLTEVRLSDREFYQFKLKLESPAATVGGCFAEAAFEFFDGNFPDATLEILDGRDVFWPNGSNEVQSTTTFQTYEPRRVRLTTIQGNSYEFDLDSGGLTRLADRNGNELTLSDAGIFSNAGRSVDFTRDAEGRIAAITDPNGHLLRYEYDDRGDLVRFIDALGAVTTFEYDTRHNLLVINDPLGNPARRSEYDAEGRLIAMVDANGDGIEFAHDLGAREQAVTNALGHTTHVAYDIDGNVVSQQTPVTIEGSVVLATEQNAYDALGNVTVNIDADGVRREAAYDASSNPVSVVLDPGGLNITHAATFNARGSRLMDTDPNGEVATFAYDDRGNNTVWVDRTGRTTEFAYDGRGNPTRRVDPEGGVWVVAHNGTGQPVRLVNALGDVTEYTYDTSGNRLSETLYRTVDGAQRAETTTWRYNARNQVVAMTDALGNETRMEYNAVGLLSERIDALGRRTSFEYDAVGALVRTVFPDGTSTTTAYDAVGNVIEETDQQGRVTRHEYDELRRLVRSVDADGTSEAIVYSPAGREVARIDRLGHRTDFEYDAAGRQVLVRYPEVLDAITGAPARPEIRFEYDPSGRRTAVVDALGRRQSVVYDTPTNPMTITMPDGTTLQRELDQLGREVSSTDAAGRATRFDYNADVGSRLAAVTLPAPATGQANPVYQYSYDEVGNRIAQIDPQGRATRFEFDALGRIAREELPGGQSRSFQYDAIGNLLSMTDFDGALTTFEYDAMNRLVRKLLPDGAEETSTWTPTGRRESVTDARGVTFYEYDALDRPTRITQPLAGEITYSYDARGSVAGVNIPSGTTTYSYDPLGRMTSSASDGQSTRYAYDLMGRPVEMTYPNGVTGRFEYNAMDRLLSLAYSSANGDALASWNYEYSIDGLRTRAAELDGSIETYVYDDLKRLIAETRTGNTPHSRLHEYDAVGNRTRVVLDGVDVDFTFDANDQLLSRGVDTFQYDARGNLVERIEDGEVTTLTWTPENHLASVNHGTDTTVFSYDVDGNRVGRESSAGVSRFLLDTLNPTGFVQVAEERDDSDDLRASYRYGLDLLGMRNSSGERFVHADAHGNTRLLSDAPGTVTDAYAYDAYGALTDRSGMFDHPYLYAGEQFESDLGAYYLRARYYDPALGRFLSRDPFAGVDTLPVSLHKYLYAHADPVNLVDPTGNTPLFQFLAANLVQGTLRTINTLNKASKICRVKGLARALTAAQGLRHAAAQATFTGGLLNGSLGTLGVAAGYGGASVGQSVPLPGYKHPLAGTSIPPAGDLELLEGKVNFLDSTGNSSIEVSAKRFRFPKNTIDGGYNWLTGNLSGGFASEVEQILYKFEICEILDVGDLSLAVNAKTSVAVNFSGVGEATNSLKLLFKLKALGLTDFQVVFFNKESKLGLNQP